MTDKTPKRLVCPKCGGTEVVAEAFATWNEVKQDWDFELYESEEDFCADCHDLVCAEFVPITDLKSAARVAINQVEKE